jgi:hypothetical protein
MAKQTSKDESAQTRAALSGLVNRLLDVVGDIPAAREPRSAEPERRARSIARMAAGKAAAAAGALALPPGPLGWLTIAPELYAVWRIQAQMVADIAGAYGKPELLGREQMLYCLFSHTSAKVFQDLVVRIGQRYVVRRAPISALYGIANKITIRLVQRSASRLVTRWVPLLGAMGVAGYVFVDTGRAADASMQLFAADVRIEGEVEPEAKDKGSKAPAKSAKPSARRGASRSAPRASRAKAAAVDKTPPPKPRTGRRAAPKVAKKAPAAKTSTGKPRTRKIKPRS